MKTFESYAQAIDLLMGNAVDYKLLSVALAKKYPEIFVELCTVSSPSEKWVKTAINFMAEGNKVGAIKECRVATGFGLKEAKDVMDHVQDLMASKGYGHHYGVAHIPLNQELQQVFQKLENYVVNNLPNKIKGVF